MTMSTPAVDRYRLDPLDRGVIGPLTRRQVVVIGAGALVWLLSSIAGAGMVVGLIPFVAALAAAVPRFGGQPVSDWVPVWCGWVFRGRRSRHWVRRLHLTSALYPVTTPQLPPWLGGLSLVAHPSAGWAAIHDRSARTLTAHLQIAGAGFTTLSVDQMEFLVSGWGAVFSAVPVDDGVVRITWSDIARRMPLVGHDAWAAGQHGDADGLAEYREFVAATAPMRHDVVLTVTLRCGALRDRRAETEAMSRLESTVTIVRDALGEAKLAAFGPLPAGELAYLLRSGLDPSSVEPSGGTRTGSLVQHLGLVPTAAAGPMRAVVSSRHVEVDASVHRSFWVESWPEQPQPADWFEPLLAGDDLAEVTQRIFTLIVEPIDDDRALAELRHAASRHGGEQVAASEGRTRWDSFKARKANAVAAREDEVAHGAGPVCYGGLVTVTVADLADLQRAAHSIVRRFRRRRVLLRPLWGRMDLGVAAALPLGLGLSREPF
jgi:hypothetical protein